MLCEGKNDEYALRTGLAKLDADVDALSVSVVGTGNVGNLPDYARMAARLAIPWCAVSDEDVQSDGTIKPRTERARDRLGALVSEADLSLMWPGDLETCFGLATGQKAPPEWQAENVEPKPLGQLEGDYPHYVAVCRSIRAWLD